MEALPLALVDLEEARVGTARDGRSLGPHRALDRLGGLRRPDQGRMHEFERIAARDRQGGRDVGRGQPGCDERRLELTGGGERRLGLPLETAFDDVGRLAVADQHERRVESGGDERCL